jgi:predicted ATPase
MRIVRLEVERYKVFSRRVGLDLRPLTILVGRNNAGKSALARALPLLCGALAADRSDAEPLPLASYGLVYGRSFLDLVAGRSPHGNVNLTARFEHEGSILELSTTVQNLSNAQLGDRRRVFSWEIKSPSCGSWKLNRGSYDWDADVYDSCLTKPDGQEKRDRFALAWRGIAPVLRDVDQSLYEAHAKLVVALEDWASTLRYLRSPRALVGPWFSLSGVGSGNVGADGADVPRLLATNDVLRERVAEFFGRAFEVDLDIVRQGDVFALELTARKGAIGVSIEQAGQGLAQVLPVAVQSMTAREQGPGVDVIEHPEAELHPGVHAEIAELVLSNLAGAIRPVVIETHSPTLLLRARRWVAEGRLPADDLGIWWVDDDHPDLALRQVTVTPNGGVEGWPDGVFADEYEEILAIRRAARPVTTDAPHD